MNAKYISEILLHVCEILLLPHGGLYFTALLRALASSRTRLLDHIQRRATVGRSSLNE